MTSVGTLNYIDSTDYNILKDRIRDITAVIDELNDRTEAMRRLRYTEVDIELERTNGNLQPDELLIPQHIIDSNIRKEQPSYIQYVSQSQRAVVLTDVLSRANDTQLLELDVTMRVRFPKWQLSMFSLIDGMQAHGYGMFELIQDDTQPGGLAHEYVPFGDFGCILDTRDIQESEMIGRAYYFTRTKLMELCDKSKTKNPFNEAEVKKVIFSESSATAPQPSTSDDKDRSLYKILKLMFKVKGVVQVAWCSFEHKTNDWLRNPVPLRLGRRKLLDQNQIQSRLSALTNALLNPKLEDEGKKSIQAEIGRMQNPKIPPSVEMKETSYPYFLAPYLNSENPKISDLKGRTYLDQDCQEAITSLMSCFCTAHRRASMLLFSKDTSDPNDDFLLQKNIYFQNGALINSKVSQLQLKAPEAEMLSAIQMLAVANQSETSQVNFAVNNRKDSRKTAREIDTASNQQQQLSTVQVVLFSIFLSELYGTMFDIIQSRVNAGLIEIDPTLKAQYQRKYIVKPSGDSDVIQRQQITQTMMSSWGVMQNTPAATPFLCDLLTLLFPDYAPKYIKIFQDQQQQAQSQQAQQQQAMLGVAKQAAEGIISLSKKPEMFSEQGRIHAFPVVKNAADKLEQMMQPQQPNKQ